LLMEALNRKRVLSLSLYARGITDCGL